MDVLHTHCAGLDVHTHRPTLASGQGHGQQTVVAAVRVPEPKKKRGWQVITQTFGTMTADLLALSDWLLTHEVTHAATPAPTAGAVWRVPANTGSRSTIFWKQTLSYCW